VLLPLLHGAQRSSAQKSAEWRLVASFPASFYQPRLLRSCQFRRSQGNYHVRWVQEAGVRQFIAAPLILPATDETDQARLMLPKVRRGVVQLPTVGGTIAIAFQTSLCLQPSGFTQKQVADVFLVVTPIESN